MTNGGNGTLVQERGLDPQSGQRPGGARALRLLLVEDHLIVREGIRRLLELEADLKVVGEASNGQEALALAKRHQPDLVLMDVRMPGADGIQVTKEIKSQWPEVRVLILTMHCDCVREAIQAGADGFVSKDLRREELVQAIHEVVDGQAPLRLTLDQQRLREIGDARSEPGLSDRERDVLRMVASGASEKEIMQQLSMSETTVKRAIRHACEKLGAKNRAEAVAEAVRHQYI